MKEISGGVTAPIGFRAGGIHAGVKHGSNPDKPDLALIVSEREAAAAATYTLNRVKAAPIYVTMDHLENGVARAIVANSGNANACAAGGHENAEKICALAAEATGLRPEDFIVASTGVIGVPINVDAIGRALPALAGKLSVTGSDDAAHAIMTTDTKEKQMAVTVELGGKAVTLGAIAKGSGMIHPNMGTMLCFLTTDCAIAQDLLHEALSAAVKVTFNHVSVDGDTSTNDMCCILANGEAGNPMIEWRDDDYAVFCEALKFICTGMARKIAADGEGASKLLTCHVQGARSADVAERMSMEVIKSSLVKTAMFGADANWGRILCAMGYSKAPFRPEYVDIGFRTANGPVLPVCSGGEGLPFDETVAKKILTQAEVVIEIDLHEGDAEATAWGCDLTYDYVRINGDYRT